MPRLAPLIAALGLLALAPPAGASFYANDWEQKPIKRVTKPKAAGKVKPLPAALVVKPGRYRVGARRYDMRRQGFYSIGRKQRIVYRDRLPALMSGLSWAMRSDGADDGIGKAAAAEELAKRPLGLICGNQIDVAQYVLAQQGIRSRHVGTLSKALAQQAAPGQLPGLDHVMLEVQVRGRWQLWDVYNNGRPLVDGRPTTVMEWVRPGDRTLDRVAEDDNKVRWHLSAFYRAASYTPLVSDSAQTWPFYFTDPRSGRDEERQRDIEAYRSGLIYQSRADFFARWYPGQPPRKG
jgi:hypothetical protein